MPSWVDLATSDQPAAKLFYGRLFGWEWQDNYMGEGQRYSMAVLKGRYAAAVFETTPMQISLGVQPHWNTYIAVDNVDETVTKIAPAGGKVIAPPFNVLGSGRMAVIADPTGGTVSLWQPVRHIGAGIVGEPGAMAWNELITDDVERASSFFAEALGVEIFKREEPFPYSAIMVDGRPVADFMRKPTEIAHIPNGWAVDFAVADCDSTAKKAESLGGQVLAQPRDSPAGRFAVLRDPQGAVFSALKLNGA